MYFFTYFGCPRSLLLRVLTLAVPGLCRCLQALSSWGERPLLSLQGGGPRLRAAAPGTQLQWLRFTGSGARLQQSEGFVAPCGIFRYQGLNPRLLHERTDSSPLSRQGKPSTITFF